MAERPICNPCPSFAAILLLAAGTACGPADRGTPLNGDLSDLLSDTEGHVVHVGRGGSGNELAVFSRVSGARVSPAGRVVVVLDPSPPFLRVFDSSGDLSHALVPRGGGPGEARRPGSFAVSDSLILLAHDGSNLSLFDVSGRFIARHRVDRFVPLGVTRACTDDAWIVYGPSADAMWNAGDKAWLHYVELVDGGKEMRHRPVYSDSTRVERLMFGKRYDLVTTEDHVYVLHGYAEPPQILAWSCRTGETSTIPTVEPEEVSPRRTALQGGGTGTILTLPDTLSQGIGVVDSTLVSAWLIGHADADAAERTEFRAWTGAEWEPTAVTGDYEIRDSQPGVGLVLSSSDSIPEVFLIAEREFSAALAGRTQRQ